MNTSAFGSRALDNIDWLMDNNTDDLMEVLLDLASAPTEEDLSVFLASGTAAADGAAQVPAAENARAALQRIALEVYALRVYVFLVCGRHCVVMLVACCARSGGCYEAQSQCCTGGLKCVCLYVCCAYLQVSFVRCSRCGFSGAATSE